jgi:ATP-dependent Clp protease ATP-binding subunit ClpA
MHGQVIGQAQAINAIANAMRRSRANITETKKPIGSFLFLGPTGVGKTETAKAWAAAYFGGKDSMIRFDMSEYQNEEDVYRLIGRKVGTEVVTGQQTNAVMEKPFSLILFDELEKANKNLLNLFLQILDEGMLTDISGKKASFSSSIIIATSNAGAKFIYETITQGTPYEQVQANIVDLLVQNQIFKPEFLNRFTQVIAFSPLTLDISCNSSLISR